MAFLAVGSVVTVAMVPGVYQTSALAPLPLPLAIGQLPGVDTDTVPGAPFVSSPATSVLRAKQLSYFAPIVKGLSVIG